MIWPWPFTATGGSVNGIWCARLKKVHLKDRHADDTADISGFLRIICLMVNNSSYSFLWTPEVHREKKELVPNQSITAPFLLKYPVWTRITFNDVRETCKKIKTDYTHSKVAECRLPHSKGSCSCKDSLQYNQRWEMNEGLMTTDVNPVGLFSSVNFPKFWKLPWSQRSDSSVHMINFYVLPGSPFVLQP